MHRTASHEPTGGLGGLMTRPGRWRMGGEISRRGDENRSCFRIALPSQVLSHAGLKVLHHVEASILA